MLSKKPPPVMCAIAWTRSGARRGSSGAQVGQVRREERVRHGRFRALPDRIGRRLAEVVEEDSAARASSRSCGDPPTEGRARRPRPDPRAVEDLRAVDDADDRARDVVLALGVEARHLRRLAAEEGGPVLAAAARDSLDDLLEHVGLDLPRRDVVEEEERPRALDEDVVDAVVDEVGAARVVAAGRDRDLQLRPDAVGRGDENRLAVRREVGPEEAAEAADVARARPA